MSKMPTKSEALEAIRDEYRAGAGGNLFEQILDRLVNLGVPFSPERVAPHRGDLLTEHTELVDDMAVRSKYGYVYVLYPLSGRWHEASASISWLTTAGLLEREPVIVDVPGESDPEPADEALVKAWAQISSHPAFRGINWDHGDYVRAMSDRLTDLVLFEQADHSGHSHPEPELVAERRDDGRIYVGADMFAGGYLGSEYYRVAAAQYAAVARLREQEEREAGK